MIKMEMKVRKGKGDLNDLFKACIDDDCEKVKASRLDGKWSFDRLDG